MIPHFLDTLLKFIYKVAIYSGLKRGMGVPLLSLRIPPAVLLACFIKPISKPVMEVGGGGGVKTGEEGLS
jgi:hypothetical protein